MSGQGNFGLAMRPGIRVSNSRPLTVGVETIHHRDTAVRTHTANANRTSVGTND
jgi:hypothetical protein